MHNLFQKLEQFNVFRVTAQGALCLTSNQGNWALSLSGSVPKHVWPMITGETYLILEACQVAKLVKQAGHSIV
ncbi:hypothetical protein Y032_0369g78 [Ancylostoma ceylanicum]|nr:hypothetical protein Y032_0369g78 [Ancylostoma ceylanicum]